MKDLARHRLRAFVNRGKPRKERREARKDSSPELETGTGDTEEVNWLARREAEIVRELGEDLTTPLDSWDPRNYELPVEDKRLLLKPKSEEPEPEPERKAIYHGRKKMAFTKRRRAALSVCVSEEEAVILRRHAAKLNKGFSEWARSTLFRAIGRKPPPRPRSE